MKTVYILDSYGLIYRAYFALFSHPLTNTRGQNISALTIFFKNLRALITHHKPEYLVAAFDSKTPTFRHELFAEYKANRQKTPEDLHAQIPWIEETLAALNIPVLQKDGYEADDIIATVAKKCAQEGYECRILSADKDLLQLVTETCKEMQPDKNIGGWETVGKEQVIEKWGIGPEKILDYLSLVGDAADNVPGVKGVGEKTALKLLNEYGTLDGIYEHAAEIKGALGEKIRNDRENAYFSKKLITLMEDVPVEIDFNSFSTADLNFTAAAELLHKHEAYSVAKLYAAGSHGSSETSSHNSNSAGSQSAANSAQVQDFFQDQNTDDTPIRQNQKETAVTYKAITSISELAALVDSILASDNKTFAFDTETTSLNTMEAQLVGFSISTEALKACYIPVILPGGMFAPETISKTECINQILRLFSNPEVTVIMHNAKYDLQVLLHNGMNKMPDCRIFDTMIAAWLLNPNAMGKSPYSLEYLAETKLRLKGIEFADIVQKGQTFADLPLETAFPYAAEDADFTIQLYNKFLPAIESDDSLKEIFWKTEMNILPVLAQMEINGIHLEPQILKDYSVELTQKISDLEKEIHGIAGHEFNIGSPKQLQTVLFEERGLKTGKKTKTGYSTDTAVLEELADETDDPLPSKILEWRGASKLLSTYVQTLPQLCDKNNRIHTSFMQTGTATGRLSSRDPNLQNIPVRDESGRKIRSAFVAPAGKVLISADYAQIELAVLAHLSGDKNLCSAFINGVDVHKSTAALIYGIQPDNVTADMRRLAKTVNFGVMYGMSAFRLAKDLGISRTEANNFITQYFNTYSDVKRFINETIVKAQETGFVQTFTGRRRPVTDINNKNKLIQQAAQRIAINSPIQGSAADIVKKAMLDIDAALKENNSPVKMLLQVHDELIFECPEDQATVDSAVKLIRNKMENAFKLSIPLRVSIETGRSWGEFH